MKSHLVLISAIVVATAAFGVSGSAFSEPRDAHVQAAALLNRPHVRESLQTYEHAYVRSSSAAVDAHVSAAALLSGQRTGGQGAASVAVAAPTVARTAVDAHARAAALLSGSRTADRESSRPTRIGGG
jgi:hypothetical protein